MKPNNNFGPMSNEYDSARRGYPEEVYVYLHSLAKTEMPSVLDVGCGTGISTRELKEYGFNVIGVDKDATMIEMAKKNSKDIKYAIAAADDLPFSDNKFDIVTAFTSFHWFNNKRSLLEIKRVLRNKGIFFAALKSNRQSEDSKEFRDKYIEILKKYAGDNFDSTKEHFKIDIVKNLFTDVAEKSFYIDEKYTIDDALVLIRSLSLWNLVKDIDKSNFLNEIKSFFESNLIDGFVVRNREIFVLSGSKAD